MGQFVPSGRFTGNAVLRLAGDDILPGQKSNRNIHVKGILWDIGILRNFQKKIVCRECIWWVLVKYKNAENKSVRDEILNI